MSSSVLVPIAAAAGFAVGLALVSSNSAVSDKKRDDRARDAIRTEERSVQKSASPAAHPQPRAAPGVINGKGILSFSSCLTSVRSG